MESISIGFYMFAKANIGHALYRSSQSDSF